MERMTKLLGRCAPAAVTSSGHPPGLAQVAQGGSCPSFRPQHRLPHMRVCSAVRRAGESIDAQLAAHGISWLLLHSPSRPDHPVGLRVGWSSGPRSHEADSTPKVAPAVGSRAGVRRLPVHAVLERRPRLEWDLEQYSARTASAVLATTPGG